MIVHTAGITASVCVKDMDTSEDRVGIYPAAIDVVCVDVGSEIATCGVPEVVLEEAENLLGLVARCTGGVELLG